MHSTPDVHTASTLEPPPALCSLETADADGIEAPSHGYCPGELLGRFTLLMAGHGRCVSAAMMLGDRDYALWQLACARATGDAALARLASQLFAHLTAAQRRTG